MIRYAPAPMARPTCRTALIDRMALTMREMAFAGETVDAEALRRRGFTDAAISRLSGLAVDFQPCQHAAEEVRFGLDADDPKRLGLIQQRRADDKGRGHSRLRKVARIAGLLE